VGLLGSEALNVADLITHRAPVSQAQTLFEQSKNKDYVKGILAF